jgi:hypothetical protein
MKLAYIIIAHKEFSQVASLIKSIKEDWNEIYLHIDYKSAFDINEFENCLDGILIHYILPRINVCWGHISQVEAIFNGLTRVVESDINFDRVVLLSGQDLPVVSNEQIYDFFVHNWDVEFLEFAQFPIRWWPFGGYDRVLVYNFPDIVGPRINRLIRLFQMLFFIRRKDMKNFNYYGSSTWFNITGAAANYIVSFVQENDLVNRFKYTYCVDEVFFQTILLNSNFSKNCVNDSLRHIVWDKRKSHPSYLSKNEYKQLIQSNQIQLKCLFARKFSAHFQRDI